MVVAVFHAVTPGLNDSCEAKLSTFSSAHAYRMIHLRKAQHAVRLDYGLIEMQAKADFFISLWLRELEYECIPHKR